MRSITTKKSIRLIVLSLFLCVQSTVASVNEYASHTARIIVSDDFFLPIAKIGVIYSVGLDQLTNIGEAEILAESFLSENTKLAAKKLGTELSVNIYDKYSEVSAIVSVNQITNLIKTLLNNRFSIDKLELIKGKIRLRHKLSSYYEAGSVSDHIFSIINKKHIFNFSIFENLSEADLQKSLDKYKNAHIDIIICGQVSSQELVQLLDLKKLPPREHLTNQLIIETPKKDIDIKSKFLSRSLFYLYKQKKQTAKQNAILAILNYEIFDYFQKHSQIINGFSLSNAYQFNSLLFKFLVRRDVSTKVFEQNYRSFLSYLKNKTFTPERLNHIAKLEALTEIDETENVDIQYNKIKAKYILKIPTTPNSQEIPKVSSEDIKNFVEQTLENDFFARISTAYKGAN